MERKEAIGEIYLDKIRTEEEISEYISNIIEKFYDRNGITPYRITIDMVDARHLGEPKRNYVNSCNIDIRIE